MGYLVSDGPDWRGSVGLSSSRKVKGRWFISWSGRMPGLQVQSLVGVCMFLSHIDVSLPLSKK